MKIPLITLIFLIIWMLLFIVILSSAQDNINSSEVNSNDVNKTVERSKRVKRYLGFRMGTRVFLRINVKDNIIKVNQIWAQAYGFRANLDILYPGPFGGTTHKLKRRSIYDTLETLIDQHGFDGRACIMRSFCESEKSVQPHHGMLFKLFQLIFRNSRATDLSNNNLTNTDNYQNLTETDCDLHEKKCPLSLMELTPYTDI